MVKDSQVDRALCDSLALFQASPRVLVLLFALDVRLVHLGARDRYPVGDGHQDCISGRSGLQARPREFRPTVCSGVR